MLNDVESILINEDQLRNRCAELGAKISEDYKGQDPLIIGVLKGCFVFMADLVRNITIPCDLDFMAASSYGTGTESSGSITITKDITRDIKGRHIIFVEDILDTGLTLNYLIGYLGVRKPASMQICTLLDKPSRRVAPIAAQYIGFEIPNSFVIGYGLDYDEKYRNLPFVGILKPEIYE